MSLRFKFLSLLVGLPSLCLALFLYFAYTTFVEDKLLSIYEKQFQQLNFATMYFFNQTDNATFGEDFQNRFDYLKDQEGYETVMLVDNQGHILKAAQKKLEDRSLEDFIGHKAFQKLLQQNTLEGSFEALNNEGERSLYSYSKAKIQDQSVILLLYTELKGATRATMLFLLKSISALLALIGVSIIVSLYFSKSLTSGIGKLSQAMKAFGEGSSDVVLPQTTSNDEIGRITTAFASMKQQIVDLMASQAKQAGIETEMRLTSDLQTRFFPASTAEYKNAKVAISFEPAEYAGGDWLFYFKKDHLLFFIVADATGHGLLSAMLTAISRSAISLAEDMVLSPRECMRLLNHAIFSSVQNQINMTCFIGALDTNTGIVKYSSAAHEEPFVFPATSEKVKASNIPSLSSPAAKRLGEVADAEYEEQEYQLNDGDTLLLYTDGLTDLKNAQNESFSDRSLLRLICKNINSHQTPEDVIHWVDTAVKNHRQEAPLADDISYMTLQWRKQV